MHSLKFLLDADMPRSSGEVIQRLGFDIENVRDIGMRAASDIIFIIRKLSKT